MKNLARPRAIASLIVIISMLAVPMVAFAKKGEKYYNQGIIYEKAQQWEKAAEQYALAVAANPADTEYQLRYRRSIFNASQSLMMQGRALAEKNDFVGAYNAFRQSYAYDPVNELALSEMERMLRLQRDKDAGAELPSGAGGTFKPSQTSLRDTSALGTNTPAAIPNKRDISAPAVPQTRVEQQRIVTYSGDLKAFIRSYAELLGLNVVFDSQSFRQPRNIDISLKEVTAAQALDYVFLQEGLFFQKLGRRTILVADQQRRGTYQQLVIRTFYLSNLKPADAQKYISTAIPAQAGRPTTIAIPDPDTNSITIRDTAENVRLIGDILSSLDKDRAEVVMDVNIYEVSRDDLLKIGNQIGTNTTLVNLGTAQGGISSRSDLALALPKALGVGFALPPSAIAALQGRDRTRLVFSTQIHAFNNEESTARIGQRVPVQTAQTFPFGTSTTTGQQPGGVNTGVGFAGGFPVFNYEQTGLTLKFQPQIFPNLDVQVKMSIESKDVTNPGNPTPTFTERSIAGTARIQNNRTMMLASIAQGSQSQSRVGLPLLGLIPILGRFFTAPEDRNRQVDIVIAVTPRVLRAPAVTPDDELMRASGTLQTPTSGSVQAVLEEADREDQLAAASAARNQQLAQNAQPQPQQTNTQAAQTQAQAQKPILDEEPPAYVPAPRALMGNGASATATGADAASNISKALPANIKPLPVNVPKADLLSPGNASSNTTTTSTVPSSLSMPVNNAATPKSLSANATPDNTAEGSAPPLRRLDDTVTAKPSFIGPQLEERRDETQTPQLVPLKNNASESSPSKAATTSGAALASRSAAGLMLLPSLQEMRVGEHRRLSLLLKTDAPLGLAALTFKFNPQQVRISGVSMGNMLAASEQGAQPVLTQSVDAKGFLLISVAPSAGAQPMTGAGVLVFIDIEAVAPGESIFSFDNNNVHLVATDGRSVALDLSEVKVVVKQ